MDSQSSPALSNTEKEARARRPRVTRNRAAATSKKRAVDDEDHSESEGPPSKKTRQTRKSSARVEKLTKSPAKARAAIRARSQETRPKKAFAAKEETEKEEHHESIAETDGKAEPSRKEAATDSEQKPIKAKRKTKAEKEAEMQPLAARTLGSKVLVGAHVSASGGPHKSITNSVHIGGNAFALFLKSQRKWANPALKADDCKAFHAHCKEHTHAKTKSGHLPVLPHGSYLVNLAHPDAERKKQAYDSFLDDLDRCHQLGIGLYNFHPGNGAANPNREDALKCIADNLNDAHADPKTGKVVTLLETMAATGSNTIGSTFEDIAGTIALVDDKDRVGVCLDTCHIFAAGYDIRTLEAWKDTMDRFDKIIGLKYLKALHMNDSKAPLQSGRDLHANIGTGFIGLRGFWNVMNDERIWGLPLILETPTDKKDDKGKAVEDKSIWTREIKLLESLVGMDMRSKEFIDLEVRLKKEGEVERRRIQEQVDKRKEKKVSGAKKGGKSKRNVNETEEDESEEA